jgi:D-glycero-alpha-D-manno-heptose 1-phosphate guanylyltransferase
MLEAIVLAGGQGIRLRAIIRDLPKPMADIRGRPFLWWLMRRLNDQHVARVILSVGYKSEAIRDYFGDALDGMEISYSLEREPLGTGGAMKLALTKASESQIIVLNGDTYADVDLQNLMGRFARARTDLGVAVAYRNDVARYGAIAIEEKSNALIGFNEKSGLAAGYINAGVYCLRRDIFLKYSTPAKFSFERDFLSQKLAVLRPVALKGVRWFIDIGIPEDYARATALIPAVARTSDSDDLPAFFKAW